MTQTQEHNVPALRFPEFSGEWDSLKLGDIAAFSKGKGISKADISEDGAIECIRYGQLYTDYGETIEEIKSRTSVPATELVLSEANDIIIPASGETQIDIATASCVLKDGVALGGDLNIVKTSNNGVFLSYYLNSKRKIDIARLSQGISVVHLYAAQLKTLHLNLPDAPEQRKIASFLSQVDRKIAQLGEKKALLQAYKKGMMQKLFSQELRFKDPQGHDFPDWVEKPFSDTLKPVPTKKYQINSSQFLEEGKHPVIDQGKMPIAGYSNDDAKLFSTNGAIVYGDHTTIVKFVNYNFIVGADGTKVLETLEPNIKYLFYCLSFFNVEAEGYKRHFSILKKIRLPIPSMGEQQKIADFLSSIDRKIGLVADELDHAKTFKKGLLQQMFI